MTRADTAHLAALLGAVGAPLVLAARRSYALVAGFVLLAAAELGLAVSLVPTRDLERLTAGPLRIGALTAALVLVTGIAAALYRFPWVAPFGLLLAAPFRLPVTLGEQRAFLLVPLYVVLSAAVLALLARAVSGRPLRPVPWLLAAPASVLLALSALSLLWAEDRRGGSVELVFFLFPFAALVAVVARSELPRRLERGLAATLVALASLFALIGLWQAWRREVFFARDVETVNAYTTFFRVTSVFKDPSLYGRHVVLGLVVVLVALWLRRLHVALAAGLATVLFAGLYFAYSQSSLVALFTVTLALALVVGDRRNRRVVVAAAAVLALVAAGASAAIVQGESLRKASSGRSRLVEVTVDVAKRHPLYGVGVGSQRLASAKLSDRPSRPRGNASHTTPLTVAAELGAIGAAAYLGFLAGAAGVLLAAYRRRRELGLGLAAVFGVLVVHSLFYSGFFEDPLMWGSLALAASLLPGRDASASVPAPLADLAATLRARLPEPTPTVRRAAVVVLALLLLVVAGLLAAARLRDRPQGKLDTELRGVSVLRVAEPSPVVPVKPRKRSYRFLPDDRVCWRTFGRTPARTLALPNHLGRPKRHFWVRGLRSYIEFPPVYCDGVLYVNTFRGTTYAIDSHNGRVLWKRRQPGVAPSSPAIAGPRLIVSSKAGTVTAYARANGRLLWQFRVNARVESSPVAVGRTVYFGASDGRLFALDVRTGRVRWAYDTGGLINASPSIVRKRICITTYAGSVFCLRRSNGHKLWSRYIKRDLVRYESFYASPSTDGRRLFTIARSGKVVALSVLSGRVLWTHRLGTLGYSTPAVAEGRVFVGDFNGTLHAYRAANGRELWRRYVGGRILGPPFVVGRLVFFSTLEERTYGARVRDGRIVWRVKMGKYSPGIATDRHYFFSLNGILIAYFGEHAAEYGKHKKPRKP